ncbi:PAP2 superfamily protein [Nitzschia inconspicua]|uniref:PAP2 superfamily protein n=1 Tax=Nitzschia inconspicua TaxID=303405 RepID=A0A9K3KCL5_9STRA|nr:PAP2 superfamily protein [Nitzschia inconspicua]
MGKTTEKENEFILRDDKNSKADQHDDETPGVFSIQELSGNSSSDIIRKLKEQLENHLPSFFSRHEDEAAPDKEESNTDETTAVSEQSKRITPAIKTKAKHALAVVSQVEEAELRERQEKIIWRDFSFLVIALMLGCIMSFIEMNIADAEIRGGGPEDKSRGGIVDAGFILTKPLHDYLEKNRGVNDLLAAINSLIGVFGPFIYMVYQTTWVGDFDPIFRYLTISAMRSICGWVTFLPPDKSYLASHYDFPDIAQCLIKDCGDPTNEEIQPFVTFFSGHVATLVICANHMYLNGFRNLGIFLHFFDIFQIVRLLATRGHYSIDIVIGWYMAIHVSNVAGRLGRHFSRGDKSLQDLLVPVSRKAAFEQMTGVTPIKEDLQASRYLEDPNTKKLYESFLKETDDPKDIAEPAARIMAESMMDSFLETIKDYESKKNE